jgi:hypothetical protein
MCGRGASGQQIIAEGVAFRVHRNVVCGVPKRGPAPRRSSRSPSSTLPSRPFEADDIGEIREQCGTGGVTPSGRARAPEVAVTNNVACGLVGLHQTT